MKRKTLSALIINDDDLECKCKKEDLTLDQLNLSHVGFVSGDLEKYDLVVYSGKKGQKIIKIKDLGN